MHLVKTRNISLNFFLDIVCGLQAAGGEALDIYLNSKYAIFCTSASIVTK